LITKVVFLEALKTKINLKCVLISDMSIHKNMTQFFQKNLVIIHIQ